MKGTEVTCINCGHVGEYVGVYIRCHNCKGSLYVKSEAVSMKYILVNHAFVVPVEESKLRETLDLIRSNGSTDLIIENTVDDCMKHGQIDLARVFAPFDDMSTDDKQIGKDLTITDLLLKIIHDTLVFATEGSVAESTVPIVKSFDECIRNVTKPPIWSLTRYKDVMRFIEYRNTEILPEYLQGLISETIQEINSLWKNLPPQEKY